MVLTQSQVQDIQGLISNTIQVLCSDSNFLKSIADNVASIVNDNLKKTFEEHRVIINSLKQEVATLKLQQQSLVKENLDLKSEVVDLQQYSRRNCIRIFGIKEQPDEDTDNVLLHLFKSKLNLDIDINCIDRSHRVGKNTGRGRHIIARFVSYRDRNKVFQHKKLLKGSGITITEDLVKSRLGVYKLAQNKFKKENVWTMDGRVFVKFADKKYIIRSQGDLDELLKLTS
ncbi:hypothetical protein PPYR_04813 [Photinus pyralis]|uniref:Uncharacterized protein n=1 Tax=Photinus pyralis TaxID=7054 RepID=A0A5N4AZ51_PHOPY|nr:hypothetical protein PPYR_04813 [Photinus pyralis]